MGVTWTKEQQQVIELQKRNILVSAAAGSGKTAVLVERILQMITRKKQPIDIDRLLVVTFTRAAAGEMRERLIRAIEKKLENEPENEHLQRQQTLIHNAQITTIDGFCSYVIRNYFHTIDLDPGFRVANEGELRLLKQDTVKELLEREYAKDSPDFQRFVETFATGKTDEGLGELILQLYDFSMSNPWPEEWLESCKETYEIDDFSQLKDTVWMRKMWEDVERKLDAAKEKNSRCFSLAQEEEGPYLYLEAIEDDEKMIQELEKSCKEKDFDGCCNRYRTLSFTTLSRKKGENISQEKKEQVKLYRDEVKSIIKTLGERYFYSSSAQVAEEFSLCRKPVEELVRLTQEFIQLFGEKKRKKNILDFTDMEHLALKILVKKKDGILIYTPAAQEFSQRFEEILIDEYQDSNLVQEMLLQSVSRLPRGEHNIFMVGDVKQSIYRFRLARPELFMEKYESYTVEDSPCQKINLHKNFRSRADVLEGINFLFYQFMTKELGDVEYDAQAALYPGASFPERIDETAATEILVIPTEGKEEEEKELSEKTAQELEARAIGNRILQCVGKEQIIDKRTGEYRPVEYRDCVILLRTLSGWSDTFVRVLMDMGIPAYASSKTGYFSTKEVITVLNYLHICDNPRQEIPFTGVLLSPMGECSAEELAQIKGEFPEEKIYQCARKYEQCGKNEKIREKLSKFFKTYENMRERVPYTPIHQLIQLILKATGYDLYVMAMPGGKQRKANLDMLVEKAMEYETTSYKGLFNFIRYIEQLQKYQVDFGEVSTMGENENTVRIMSIHKSKGLEFPIVFVAGMGKQMNMMDANNTLIIHPDLGIGTNGVDPELRIKMKTLIHNVMQKQIKLETLGEELRVLYVAFTRAKEKLILTGTLEKIPDRVKKMYLLTQREERCLPYEMIENATTYWDWILPALARHPSFDEWYEKMNLFPNPENPYYDKQISFSIQEVSLEELAGKEMRQQISAEERFIEYSQWDRNKVYEKETKKILEEKFSYVYPYEYLQEIPAKLSVSQLKQEKIKEEEAQQLFEEQVVPVVPSFMKDEENIQSTTRGTMYHKVMELLDYKKTNSLEEIQEQIEKMNQQGFLDEQTISVVKKNKIFQFVKSPLGQRMKQAAFEGRLYRERPFVMSIPAAEKNPLWGKEPILVQGIIDGYFEEKDGIVLIDYKTDRIANVQEFQEHYRIQLQYYAMALERGTGKKVKESFLYSFYLEKVIPIVW